MALHSLLFLYSLDESAIVDGVDISEVSPLALLKMAQLIQIIEKERLTNNDSNKGQTSLDCFLPHPVTVILHTEGKFNSRSFSLSV